MPVLSNPKHERYAQELAKGKSQVEAYELAGYKPNDGHAARLAGNGRVAARVSELMERAATKTVISITSVTESLLRIAEKAENLGEAAALSVAKGAWMDAAKVNGLIIDKSVSVNKHASTDWTTEELVAFITDAEGRIEGDPPPAVSFEKPSRVH